MTSSRMEIRRSAALRLAEVVGNITLVGMIWLNSSLQDGGFISTLLLLLPTALFLSNAIIELAYLLRGNPAVVSIADEVMTVRGPLRTKRFALSDVSVAASSRLLWPGSVVIKSADSSVTLTDFEIGRKSRVALTEFFRSR